MEALKTKAQTYTNGEIVSAIREMGAKTETTGAEEIVLEALVEVCIDRLIESGKTADEAAEYVESLMGF